MFEGFTGRIVNADGGSIFARVGGDGPPLLLLHGFPQTHVMWWKIAEPLAEHFTVVTADLRGYGASAKPTSTADHAPYCKRAMGIEMVAVMAKLGFDAFAIAGHDRGGRLAYRMALDHPQHVRRLSVLDIVPTSTAFDNADMRFALGFWPWSLLAQDEPFPERLIMADPEIIVEHPLNTWSNDPDAFPQDIRAAYIEQFRNSDTVHAVCEEYRAAASLDYQHDKADVGRKKIMAPTQVLWSATGAIANWYEDALEVWRDWAVDVSGRPINCGHFLPEEAPDETLDLLVSFFRQSD